MSKAELISKIDRSLVNKKNELDILRRGRGDEVRKWERNVVEIEQRVSQLLRDMRESGLEKLSKVSYKHAAKMTQNQSLLLTYKAKALLAVNGEETEQLLKDFENDLKLSDSNPISLCPQVTVNGDELVNLITNLDVKTELVQVPRPTAIDLDKQQYHSISFSLIENSKWQLPLVIGSRHDKGIELMNRLLFPFRSCTDLERTSPSQSKWNFGMTSFNDSFARVSFRIYNREDENLNQVLVIFLDDAKKQPRWTRSDQKFYRIPAQFSFGQYPAYTYHIWLTDKDNEWSQYGSNPIPLEKRNQIREFIGKYKTYDSTVPDVNCTVKLKSSRGKHEPWAYEGDIYLATMKDEDEPLPECSPSLSDFIATLQVKLTAEADDSEDETSAEAPISEEPQTEEKSSVQLTSSAMDLIDEPPTSIMKSYHMNSEEKWRNISSVGNPPGGAHEYEDEFWPRGGATLSQSAILNQYLNELGIKAKLEECAENPNLARFLSHLFDKANVIADDSSGQESLDEECDVTAAELDKYETLLAAEIIIWQINGSDSLRERLIMIQTVEYPEFSEFYHMFGLPCLYKKAYGLLCLLRYDQVPVQNSADSDSAFEDVFEGESEEEYPYFIKRGNEGEYDYLPLEWPSLIEDSIEESQSDSKDDPSTSISPDIRPNESLEESNESFSSILSNEKRNDSTERRNTRTESMSENADRQITRTHDNSSDQTSHSTPESPPLDSSSSIPTCNSDEVSPEIPDEPEFETWEVHGKSNKQTKSSPDLIHGRAPKFGEDFKPRPNGNRRNQNRSPDEGGFNMFNKSRSKKPNNSRSGNGFGGSFNGGFGGGYNNGGIGHQAFPSHNDFDHRTSGNRDRDVFLLKPNERRFNREESGLNYGGFGGSRFSSNNTLDPCRQRRNRRKVSTDVGSVDRFPAYNNNNSAAKKSFVPNPPNPIPNRMVRIPNSNGWHSDYTSGTTSNVNSKPKSRKVPPAPPRLSEPGGPVSGATTVSGVTKITGTNISTEKSHEFERTAGRKKKECKTDVEDACYHNAHRASRKYRRREPFHGDESSNSSQEPEVEFGDLQPGEGMSGMFTADESSNKVKSAYQPSPAPVVKTNSATIAELPRPCWKKTPNDDLFALITGISHWRQSEVKQLFEFCEPRDVRPAGKDWVLYFNDKVNMMTSRMIDGTELKKGSHGDRKSVV